MSKIGKKPITIPSGVTIAFSQLSCVVTGPKGSLTVVIPQQVSYTHEENIVSFVVSSEDHRSLWGTTYALFVNAIVGVTEGYTKTLQMIGVGFSVRQEGTNLIFQLGFSHPIVYPVAKGVTVEIQKDPKGNALLIISSIDKFLLGNTCALIRSLKEPEPYKGKGIRFFGETIKMKAGKSAKKGK